MTAEPSQGSPTLIECLAGAWGLFAALLLLMLGNGLLGTLLGVRLELEGFGTATIGFVLASYYVGFLFGSQLAPRFLIQVGHVRVFAALASLASTAALVHATFVAPLTWALMRVVTGFSLAGLYVVAESWLNDRATNATRGRLLSMYMVTLMGGIAAGQVLLNVTDPGGFKLFVLASVLVSLAVLPITLSAKPGPGFQVAPRLALRTVWEAAPLGIVGGLAVGAANGALIAMGAVYGAKAEVSVSRISAFIGLALLGAILFQIPIGAVSDRVPRRRAILVITIAAAGTTAIAAGLTPSGPGVLVAFFVLGGLTFPLYSLVLSHLNDVLPAGSAVAASSMYVFMTGVGAIFGPVFAAVLMTSAGPRGFFDALTLIHAALGVFVLYRILTKRGVPTDQQKRFAGIPARASAVIAHLAVARRRDGRRDDR